jgi:hypothetical protein
MKSIILLSLLLMVIVSGEVRLSQVGYLKLPFNTAGGYKLFPDTADQSAYDALRNTLYVIGIYGPQPTTVIPPSQDTHKCARVYLHAHKRVHDDATNTTIHSSTVMMMMMMMTSTKRCGICSLVVYTDGKLKLLFSTNQHISLHLMWFL